MTAHSIAKTTWIDDLRELLKQGLEYDPATTRAIVQFASTRGTHQTLNEYIERLPPSCRGRARRIVSGARRAGATDERICRLVILAHNRLHSELLVQAQQASH